jgi:hypothetical protein
MRQFALVLLWLTADALAQMPPGAPKPPGMDAPMREKMERIERGLRQLGPWEQQYAYGLAALERVYERNRWNSEPDRFSLWLYSQVEQIPPWNFQQRFDKAIEALGERYVMDVDQRELLRSAITREMMGLVSRHAPRVIDYSVEVIETRARSEPFTAEQVARWSKLAEPVFNEARQRLENVATELMSELRPDQQELIKADLEAAWGRLERIDQLRREWSRGNWSAADWGLDGDPIQTAGEERLARQRGADPSAPAPLSAAPVISGQNAVSQGQTAINPAGQPSIAPTPAAPPGMNPSGMPDPQASPAPVTANHPTAATIQQPGWPAPPIEYSTPRSAAARRTVVGAPAPEAEDEWSGYTRAFIQKYKLNDQQQQQAWRVYREAKERGDRTRQRFAPQIEAARTRAQANTADAAAAKSSLELEQKQSAALNRAFEGMKDRLERIPTRAQRRNASPGEIRAGAPPRPTTRPARRP